jgi:hypothetical protein
MYTSNTACEGTKIVQRGRGGRVEERVRKEAGAKVDMEGRSRREPAADNGEWCASRACCNNVPVNDIVRALEFFAQQHCARAGV